MFAFFHNTFNVDAVKTALYYVEIFFVLYLTGYSTFLFASTIISSVQLFKDARKKQLRNIIHHDYYVPISIIVPAHNEAVTIVDTINSLVHLDYKIYEIIIVNDGSTDNTGELVSSSFHLRQVYRPIHLQLACQEALSIFEGTAANNIPITLVNKQNGGKADSINMGINVSQYPYFVCMDADSILQRDSLEKIAIPVFENKNVIAVGSMIRISNGTVFKDGKPVETHLPQKLIPALQVLEYERSFLASRILLDKFNANLIVSGAFGLFKKDAVLNVGGYKVGSVGEDMELIMKLHSYYSTNHLPYAIKYAYDAVCWTQAPERLRDLIKQRRRWHIGLMQSMAGHKLLTKFSYLYYLFYELLSPMIELVGIFATLLACAFDLLNIKYMVLFFLVYALFGSMLTVISFITRNFLSDTRCDFKDILKAFLLCLPENILLRFLMAWTRLFAILFYRRKQTKWGQIQRNKIEYDTDKAL